jgi:hypothetical protein
MLVVMNLTATSVEARAKGSPKLGTPSVFTDDLADTATGADVGQHSGICFRVRKPDMFVCHAGWDLQNDAAAGLAGGLRGNLVAGGLLDFNAAKFTVGIFGGTGGYSKARGQITGDASNYPPTTDYVLVIETQ